MIAATVLFTLSARFPETRLLNSDWGRLLIGDVISASAIIVAYLLTVLTVIPAVESKGIVQKMKEWIFYRLLIDYFRAGLAAASVLFLLSLASRPLSEIGPQYYRLDGLFSALWWGTLGYTLVAVYRIIARFLNILLAR
jgi:hypothetical protein